MKQHARFFCEYCQTEVKSNARFCSKCGKFFAAVLCPKCGKTGPVQMFTNGCPKCGYALPKNPITYSGKKNSSSSNGKSFFSLFERKNYSEDSLPTWIYIAAVVFLCLIVFIFVRFF